MFEPQGSLGMETQEIEMTRYWVRDKKEYKELFVILFLTK